VTTAPANPERWKALTAICIPIIMTSIDATILNVALPTIALALHATSAQLVWINSAYIIMFGSTILLSGSLADKYGRKGVLMLGMTVFILGSIWAGLATSPYELVAARLVQGVGGGLLTPATLSLITNIFLDPTERARHRPVGWRVRRWGGGRSHPGRIVAHLRLLGLGLLH
jgi:MFS family permease